MKVWLKLGNAHFNPTRIIEWVVALCTLISPLFVFSPLYDESIKDSGPGFIAAALNDPNLLYVYAAILLIGVVCVIIGLYKQNPKIKSAGWFTILLIRFFQVLTTILTVGFIPISPWIFPFTIMLVVAVLWINTRIEVAHGRA